MIWQLIKVDGCRSPKIFPIKGSPIATDHTLHYTVSSVK